MPTFATLITQSLYRHWNAHQPANLPTIYPGQQIDPTGWPQWCQIAITAWSHAPARLAHPLRPQVELLLDLHVQSALPAQRLEELIAQSQAALACQSVPVESHEDSDPTIVGYVRFTEMSIRYLLREESRPTYAHARLLVTGTAQQTHVG